MSMPSVDPERAFSKVIAVAGQITGGVVVLAIIVMGVAISPTAMTVLDWEDSDWTRLSEIGQAYGPVSALLSAIALCLVVLVQRAQVRHERTWLVRDMHLNVLHVALDDPSYAQCWGPRVSPDRIDERHFFYTNMIILLWFYSWESGELHDGHIRSYARGMFDSEVPREYWREFGAWRLSSARGHRRRFLAMIDAEFQAAERHGPPSRSTEPPAMDRRDRPLRHGRRSSSRAHTWPGLTRTRLSRQRH